MRTLLFSLLIMLPTLSAAEPLRLIALDSGSSRLDGAVRMLADEIAMRYPGHARVESYPFSRGALYLATEAVCAPILPRNGETEEKYIWVSRHMNMTVSLFKAKNARPPKPTDAVIGVQRHSTPVMVGRKLGYELLLASRHTQLSRMLTAGRIDYWLEIDHIVRLADAEGASPDNRFVKVSELQHFEGWTGCSPLVGHGVVKKLQNIGHALQQEKYIEHTLKHLGLSSKHGNNSDRPSKTN